MGKRKNKEGNDMKSFITGFAMALVAVCFGIAIGYAGTDTWFRATGSTTPNDNDAELMQHELHMTSGPDNIRMGAGNDVLSFGTDDQDVGVDEIQMHAGNDAIRFGYGADAIYMGSDADAIYMGGSDGETIYFSTTATISNNATNAVLTIKSPGDVVIEIGN